jgi:hypothetical protein
MSDPASQTYQTHRRWVPGYHFVAPGLILLYLLWRIYKLVTAFSVENALALLFVVGVALVFYYARAFALAVQDRVIRLEERLRLERLLPADLQPAAAALTTGQLVGLRFAADDEVAELVRWVAANPGTGREEIKKRIRTWRPDHQRA